LSVRGLARAVLLLMPHIADNHAFGWLAALLRHCARAGQHCVACVTSTERVRKRKQAQALQAQRCASGFALQHIQSVCTSVRAARTRRKPAHAYASASGSGML
jgi:hypothetical protein